MTMEKVMDTEDAKRKYIFDREILRRSLRFDNLRTLQPANGVGILATFELCPGLMKIKGCSLQRAVGERPKIFVGRADRAGGFSVDLGGWFRGMIFEEAKKAIKKRVDEDVAALAAFEGIRRSYFVGAVA
jgi:hypothetical protein